MAVNPGAGAIEGATERMVAPATLEKLARAYIETYHGPHGDAPVVDAITAPTDLSAAGHLMSPQLISAHYRLGRRRQVGETLVELYAADDPGGFGPALQIVTDYATLLMDSVTVLLHRLGVAYKAIMNPVLLVRRGPRGELLDIRPASEADNSHEGVDEAWIHVQLSDSVDPKVLTEVRRLLPTVLADARQVALDSRALTGTLLGLANELDTDPEGRFPGPDRKDVAALLRWLADGHFVLLGYQRCPVHDGQSTVDSSSRLGILRFREDLLPQLTDSDDLLVLAQATIPSFLRYGAYPYIVVIREHPGGKQAVEHRFCGLFTVAAMNANVMEIPLISRRVSEAIRMAQRDPSHPAQLLLDIIQTIPRSELFALSSRELLDMSMAVVDLGSRRRTLLFLRADQLAHFVSCLVYLPRDRYTTAVRLEMQDILVRELGGESIDYAARVSESPWAVVHFTVRLPGGSRPQDVDVSLENESRIQDLLTEAARTWGDRLLGAVRTGSIDQAKAEHYSSAFTEDYKQAVRPDDAIKDIAIIEELQDNSVKLVFSEEDGHDGAARLIWYLGGRSASLSQLLPMLQSMGVIVLEERPFTVTRADGLPVWIYQFKISVLSDIPEEPEGPERDATAVRFADAVTAIWHGRAEIDRFNELVLRAGLTWQQVVILRAYAKYLRQAGFPYSQAHIEGVLNGNPGTSRSLVKLFEAMFDPAADPERKTAQAAAASVAADIDALTSLDTDRVLRGFASMIQATLRTNYFVRRQDSARAQNVLAIKMNPRLIDELPLPRPRF
ncbi:MAG TPA: NAD-glutamate dehydrogenase domain-containing protein, partial [Mycobacterium sp.]|nr:NAD-glutamate dehydrogenase domain-containing protein [Mycobacterium sp.]